MKIITEHGNRFAGSLSNSTDFAVKIAEIMSMDTKEIVLGKPMDKKSAEEFVRLASPIKNLNDGRVVEIPVNTIGKIIRHKGYNISQIIENLPSLYKTSLLGWSEPEILREGHKRHINFIAYHHYINKFTDNIDEYFIRFTINEGNAKAGKINKNIIHSVAISNINIKNDESFDRVRVIDPGVKNSSPYIDKRLKDFFNSVKTAL